MAEKTKSLSRRAMLGGVVGSGAIAAAAGTTLTGTSIDSFSSSFSSPYSTLELGDHTAWAAEVGKTLAVEGGPTLRIASVETFVGYGETEGLIRSRAFLVNLQATTTGRIVGNTIHRVTHKRYGTFSLYLLTSPLHPTFAQAVFN
ncbi:MAG TPA: hypothetical protein VGC46_08955 [Allosphingosinicella sp.]|jgi:hypothetical protein